MGISASDFLNRKGAIELFCELSPHGSRWTELDNEIMASHSTVTDRIEEAQELGLITHELIDRSGESVNVYTPTNRGARFMLALETQGVAETYRHLKETRQKYEEQTEKIREWVLDNPGEFKSDDPEALKTLRYREALDFDD